MKTILSLLLAALAFDVCAASFPCAKAKSKVEKLVCADPALSKLDDELAAEYKKAASDWDTVYNGQREWLRNIRDRCTTASCLTQAYRERIEVLKHWHDPQPWSEELLGMYIEPRRVLFFDGKEWMPGNGADCLSVTKTKDGLLRLRIQSAQTNGHTCEVDLKMRRQGKRVRAIPDENNACALSLRAERGALVVEDPQATCRESCGARASLDGLTFRRSQRKPGICALESE